MLNFSITTKLARIRGHYQSIYVQIFNPDNGKYDEELSFSSISQSVNALKLKNAIDYVEVKMLNDIASEAVMSISELFKERGLV